MMSAKKLLEQQKTSKESDKQKETEVTQNTTKPSVAVNQNTETVRQKKYTPAKQTPDGALVVEHREPNGDWFCPNCFTHNRMDRKICFNCGKTVTFQGETE